MLLEGDYLHVEVDLRGLHLPFGTMAVAINSEPAEVIFDDITLTTGSPLMPVICMDLLIQRSRQEDHVGRAVVIDDPWGVEVKDGGSHGALCHAESWQHGLCRAETGLQHAVLLDLGLRRDWIYPWLLFPEVSLHLCVGFWHLRLRSSDVLASMAHVE
eukprot:symbB.v1.2.029017.t1/scaffold3125.1/size63008/4